jgi:arylsulfate sulfotransferase
MKKSNLLLFVIFMLVLNTCGKFSPPLFKKSPEIINNNNTSTPLTAFIDFETHRPIDSVIVNITDGQRETVLRYDQGNKTRLGFLLKYMIPNIEHNISLSLKDSSGRIYEVKEKLLFTPPALPQEDFLFPKIVITKNTIPTEEKLTLINPRRRGNVLQNTGNSFNQMYGLLVIVNQKGEVLWYYQNNSRISDFDLLPNGNISYITQDNKITEIDFAGNVIGQWYAAQRPQGEDKQAIPVDTPTFHHDTALLPNGNRLVLSTESRKIDSYYSSELDSQAPLKKQNVMGDVVVEFNPKGEIVHQWNTFDHMPVMRIGYETFSNFWIRRGFSDTIDWTHANAIVPIENEDAYLVNFRYQSAMVKVNKKTGAIEWIFAENSGWGEKLKDKLISLPENGLNWHQHSPRFTQSGTLLFFNNNNYQARPFDQPKDIIESPSYVVEYQIDEANKKATKLWSTENDGEEKVFSIAMGRVNELKKSGNVLACYGALLNPKYFDEMTWWNRIKYPQWTMVREYTKTKNPKVVWEMRLLSKSKNSKIGWTLFGAERIE